MGGVRRLLMGVGLCGNTELQKPPPHADATTAATAVAVSHLPGGNGVNMGHLLGQDSGTFHAAPAWQG